MVGWHHDHHDLMDTSLGKQGDDEGQGSLACCSAWGPKESDMTLNNMRIQSSTLSSQLKATL